MGFGVLFPQQPTAGNDENRIKTLVQKNAAEGKGPRGGRGKGPKGQRV